MRYGLTVLVRVCLLASALILSPSSRCLADDTGVNRRRELDEYVQKPDAVFDWKVIKSTPADPNSGHRSSHTFIRLTSQTWRSEKDVDRPVWEHWVVVIVPEKVTSDRAFLFIGGGSNDRPMPEKPDPIAAKLAEATGSIAVELRMIPNQPLIFHQDGQPRKEDDLIGYAWDQFLQTGDATWLPRLPMVKSVVRCMDCIQAWGKSQSIPIEKFVVAGGSKRGWTTWMTAAADQRVEAIVPIVIDVLNNAPSIQHHAKVYGFWATAIGNYYQHKILQRPDHPRMAQLHAIEDPYSYLDRLRLPKLVINATGDQFFCPDSSQFYFDKLQGEKLLRYVPNADHSLKNSDAAESLIAFHAMILQQRARPRYDWEFSSDGSIRVRSETPPRKVLVWRANNPKTRDFRIDTIGPAFRSEELSAEADGSYVARTPLPDQGWTAFFTELTFDSGTPLPLKVTSAVRILPDKLPFESIDIKSVPFEPQAKAKAP
ncbi:MAG: PhoPQ-activated pathogenicity [Planctomycetes bacterium]|nr:PhoPQ-activated pathogenicity [Planctomycetota bacterium]